MICNVFEGQSLGGTICLFHGGRGSTKRRTIKEVRVSRQKIATLEGNPWGNEAKPRFERFRATRKNGGLPVGNLSFPPPPLSLYLKQRKRVRDLFLIADKPDTVVSSSNFSSSPREGK